MLARQETYSKQGFEISLKQELQRPFDLQRIAGELANLIAINFEKLDVTHEILSVVYGTRSIDRLLI